MIYVDFTAGNKDYKLRLTTRNVVMLERLLGCNPIALFGDETKLPTVTQMVQILYASMQQLNHGVTLEDSYEIFDAWLEDGHTSIEFIPIIIDIYKVSGLLSKGKTEEKN